MGPLASPHSWLHAPLAFNMARFLLTPWTCPVNAITRQRSGFLPPPSPSRLLIGKSSTLPARLMENNVDLSWWYRFYLYNGLCFFLISVISHSGLFPFCWTDVFPRVRKMWLLFLIVCLLRYSGTKRVIFFFRKMERTRKLVDQGVKYYWSTI